MSSVSRYYYFTARFAWIVLLAASLSGVSLCFLYLRFPSSFAGSTISADFSRRLGVGSNNLASSPYWNVFQSRDGSELVTGGSNSRRFRLAGTFFEYVSDVVGVGDIRRAVIDDIRKGSQVIVKEGEQIDDFTVVKIFKDRVVIRDSNGVDEQLWLTFSGMGMTSKGTGSTNNTEKANSPAENADKYGGQKISENRWVFSRQKLLDYYKELRDEPERLVKVFDSFKPVYSGSGGITGYKIGIEGEPEFFKSIGLSDGDVVSSVNSIQLTSRRRAEYMISEFIADRANTFLLDVDQGSGSTKLRYDVR